MVDLVGMTTRYCVYHPIHNNANIWYSVWRTHMWIPNITWYNVCTQLLLYTKSCVFSYTNMAVQLLMYHMVYTTHQVLVPNIQYYTMMTNNTMAPIYLFNALNTCFQYIWQTTVYPKYSGRKVLMK